MVLSLSWLLSVGVLHLRQGTGTKFCRYTALKLGSVGLQLETLLELRSVWCCQCTFFCYTFHFMLIYLFMEGGGEKEKVSVCMDLLSL